MSVSVSVETRRSDDLYTGASPDGDGVEAERRPLLGGDGGKKEMGRGRFDIYRLLYRNSFVDTICVELRTHDGRLRPTIKTKTGVLRSSAAESRVKTAYIDIVTYKQRI